MDIRDFLKTNRLLFDGGMGTYCGELSPDSASTPCEVLNLTKPELISQIHTQYLQAGCHAIKTNTFCVNRSVFDGDTCLCILKKGYQLAREAAGDAFVFADIGPIPESGDSVFEEYKFLADAFLSYGADCFLFETNSVMTGLSEIARYIKEKNPSAFILTSFSPQPDGYTRSGVRVKRLLQEADSCRYIDAVGLNCVSGARHMATLLDDLGELTKPLSVMPNAGYPTVLGNRTYYDGNPSYFAQQLRDIASKGARILGGCCGTTPIYLEATAQALKSPLTERVKSKRALSKVEPDSSEFWSLLCDPEKMPFAVEFDPPETPETDKYISQVKALRDYGASLITIADCPIARARMDSGILACKLKRELNMEVMPHMTCRDRNLNAIKALLLGLSAEGVHNILAITGDPIPTASRDEVKSVYNFNSRMLAGFIRDLGEQSLKTPFRVFGALNLNAKNFEVQLRIAKEKQERGVCGFFTQPVLSPEAFENLKLARSELSAKLLVGIMPIVSHRNACFMNSDIAGITVSEEIIRQYEGVDRAQGEELAVKISAKIAKDTAPYADGYYLITPFGRTALIGRIIEKINLEMNL